MYGGKYGSLAKSDKTDHDEYKNPNPFEIMAILTVKDYQN